MSLAVENVANETDEGKEADPIAHYEEAREEIDAVIAEIETRKNARDVKP